MLPAGGVRLGSRRRSRAPTRLSFPYQLFFCLGRSFNTTHDIQRSTYSLIEIYLILGFSFIMGPKDLKKRKIVAGPKVEEVNFDSESRQEWLTGFHKRKVQRAKHAQDNAVKRYKEEKRDARKKVRQASICAQRHLLIFLDSRGSQERLRTGNGRA